MSSQVNYTSAVVKVNLQDCVNMRDHIPLGLCQLVFLWTLITESSCCPLLVIFTVSVIAL